MYKISNLYKNSCSVLVHAPWKKTFQMENPNRHFPEIITPLYAWF